MDPCGTGNGCNRDPLVYALPLKCDTSACDRDRRNNLTQEDYAFHIAWVRDQGMTRMAMALLPNAVIASSVVLLCHFLANLLRSTVQRVGARHETEGFFVPIEEPLKCSSVRHLLTR